MMSFRKRAYLDHLHIVGCVFQDCATSQVYTLPWFYFEKKYYFPLLELSNNNNNFKKQQSKAQGDPQVSILRTFPQMLLFLRSFPDSLMFIYFHQFEPSKKG